MCSVVLWSMLCGVCLAGGSVQPIVTRSTFHCISVYWPRPADGACTVDYRIRGEEAWERAQNLVYDDYSGSPVANQYRGSIVNLRPGTNYEIKLEVAGQTEIVEAPTWNETFKIKKTIRVSSQPTLATTEAGSATDGYVLYDGGGDTVLDAKNEHPHCFQVRHSYVIVRGLRMIRAANEAVVIDKDLSDVVVEHCDISQWGSLRVPEKSHRWGKTQGGIKVGSTVRRLVLQRNRIHHPRYASTRWNEEPGNPHPWGPRAIVMGHTSDDEDWEANHVIRYNEIFSDADHLLEDGICGGLNFSQTGTPGQDSDIYGNIITHATDDLIEADGGGMNVRIWGNYLAHGFIPISLQSCPLGPVYIFRNIIGPSVQHLGGAKQSWTPFKFVGNTRGMDPWKLAGLTPFNGPVYVYHNSILTPDYRFVFRVHRGDHLRRVLTRNNILLSSSAYLHDEFDAARRDSGPPPYNLDFVACSFDYDLHNQASRGDSVGANAGDHALNGEPQWRTGHGPTRGAGGRYQLAPEAPGRNAGVALPNFNRGAREEGGAPDIGAHEFDAPDMRFGVEANWTAL